MPTIFQAQCENCDYQSPRTSAAFTAILLDDESDSTFACDDEKRVVVLPHPCESHVLQGLGYTYTSSTFAGRFVAIHQLFCQQCGHLFQSRQLSAAGAIGCFPAFIIGVTVGFVIGVNRSNVWLGLSSGWLLFVLVLLTIDWSISQYVQWRFADRARAVATTRICPKCGSHDVVSPRALQSLACPCCGQNSMRVESVGKS